MFYWIQVDKYRQTIWNIIFALNVTFPYSVYLSKADPAPAHRACTPSPTPVWKIENGVFLKILTS